MRASLVKQLRWMKDARWGTSRGDMINSDMFKIPLFIKEDDWLRGKSSSTKFDVSNLLFIIHLGTGIGGHEKYTTREIYELERQIYESAVDRTKEQNHRIAASKVQGVIDRFPTLRDEQKAMIRALTQEEGGVKIALGGAGSGKSYALGACHEAWREAGYRVWGMAPTGKAAQNLEKETKIESQTVDRFLSYDQQLGRKSVIVVDEAGMMGSRKLNRLLVKAEEAGAKVILAGDPKQLQPIEAGAGARMLREGLGSIELKRMERQRVEWQREATKFFAEGKALEALWLYADNDQLTSWSDSAKARERLTKDYVKNSLTRPNESQIIITETNAQVARLNDEIRNTLKNEGKLADKATTIKIAGRDGPEEREFCLGDRIYFTKNSPKIHEN